MASNITNKSKPAQKVIQEAKNQRASTNSFTFPEDLGSFYMSFQFYDYRNLSSQTLPSWTNDNGLARNFFSADKESVARGISASKEPFARVSLPIPMQLVDTFRTAWADASMGLTGTLLSESIQGINDALRVSGTFADDIISGKQLSENDRNDTSFNSNNLTQKLSQWGDINSSTPLQAAIAVAKQGLSSDLNTLIELSTGIATNPNLTVLFQGPTLKSHRFSWKFLPRTEEESIRIRKILGIFKRAMHASRLNESTPGFLKYPSECLAEFHGLQNNFLFPLRPAIVQDISINYAPNGIPSFFQGTHEPTAIEFSVDIKETSYFLRDSFDNSSEYGSDGLNSSDLYRN